jgi:hypothetical protein
MTSSDKRIVAIHQPNFFPWLGYFNKIVRSDVFVVLDNVQYEKSSRGTWGNRVMLCVAGKAAWVTMPVVRQFEGTRLINEIKIQDSEPWRARLIKTIQMNYARAPHFSEVFPFVTSLINAPIDGLSAFNLNAIRGILEKLGLPVSKLVIGSSLSVEGAATDLLISIVRQTNGTAYMCGGGAGGYQEDEKFASAGVGLMYQAFEHPVYPQGKAAEFLPGLSIIDALMHCGFGGTRKLLHAEGSV